MKLSSIMITLIVISMFATGFVGFFGALLNTSNLDLPSEYSRLNNTSKTLSIIQGMYNKTEAAQNQSREAGAFQSDVLSNLLAGSWAAVMGVFELPSLFGAIITDVTNVPDVPIYFSTGLYAILSIILIFALYYFWTGRDS